MIAIYCVIQFRLWAPIKSEKQYGAMRLGAVIRLEAPQNILASAVMFRRAGGDITDSIAASNGVWQ